MRAVAVDYRIRDLTEHDLHEPVLDAEDQVLFQILETGICGTDRELASFRFGYGPPGSDFLVLGHEALGQVIKVGSSAASSFALGDLVVPLVRRACSPPCPSCARGRRDLCLTGGYQERGIFGAHGYFTELAVDRAEDLVRVDAHLRDTAVLLEPLSVVEKAVELALRLHQGEPSTALVLGAGTIGLLAASVLRLRGLRVTVVSVEPAGSTRAKLAETVEARYLTAPDALADIVIEAGGTPEAADTGLRSLAPLGVMILLGARNTAAPAPLIDLIVGNRIVAGSVNASPAAFRQAASDLAFLPAALTGSLVERTSFRDYRRTLTGTPPGAPKVVHVIDS